MQTDVCTRDGEVPSKWNKSIRQIHRWLSIAFTVTVIANFVAKALGDPPLWVVYSPSIPLVLLLFSGLYMFALPHGAKWRQELSRHASASPNTVGTRVHLRR